ncbi:MFS transporter [Microbulbifer thermotolerans]|uniref:Major facilitator superfamily (MFS) profile domain-containing protein n=1 Tax=Microbulbifer thermotolerans TaxID=252514 RepID=A0A143HJY9_MICTH|nr:MFS transporter [Microbulbifer thermotolerans]AMX01816.1 hypothetical protein A3224_03750 [Microbulbifer thermotolerans]
MSFVPPPAGEVPPVSPLRRATLLCLAALTIMSGATIAPSLPALQAHFANHADSQLLSRLVLTLPALFIALCAPVAGAICDRFGRMGILMVSVLLYGLAGLSGLVADSLSAILAGRALLGVSVAGIMTSITALVGDYFSGREREKYMSQQSAFVSFGGVLFLIGGGWLADLHWRAPFAIYGVALILLPAALLYLKAPTHKARAVEVSPSSDTVPYLLLGTIFATGLLNSLTFYLIPTQLPFLIREIGVEQPRLTGLAIAGGNLMGALSSLFLYHRIRAKLGFAGVFAFCFIFMASGMFLISSANALTAILAATCVFGVGMGSLMPHLFSGAIQLAPQKMRGRISGGLTASIFTGQFLSPLASQPSSHYLGLSGCFAAAGLLLLLAASAALAAALRPLFSSPSRPILRQ